MTRANALREIAESWKTAKTVRFAISLPVLPVPTMHPVVLVRSVKAARVRQDVERMKTADPDKFVTTPANRAKDVYKTPTALVAWFAAKTHAHSATTTNSVTQGNSASTKPVAAVYVEIQQPVPAVRSVETFNVMCVFRMWSAKPKRSA